MPWKLVGFIICLILGTCFAGFNLENSCNISFGFKTFQNVPIFFSLIVAFALGVIVTLPFTVIKKKSAKDRKVQAEERAMKKLQKAQAQEAKAAEREAHQRAQQEKAAQAVARKEQKAAERRQKQEAKASAVVGTGDSAAGGSGNS
ncbi:MAG: hypothetical protein IKA80_12640 [Spirochaetaceae bacterium]|nr:hypothetical protein [Spirochaetaceae bacterium]